MVNVDNWHGCGCEEPTVGVCDNGVRKFQEVWGPLSQALPRVQKHRMKQQERRSSGSACLNPCILPHLPSIM